ncbi:hypothetical protein niasHT_036670 [Heterodera trifolii]|uniref:Protein kinase domain-containing protein n=1 Tax=Heterodera trifolii TaxID=157864 RepID=A0ABD2HU34_9BILA
MEELVALPPGIRVGRWTITKKLGAGAFGAVYLCVNDEGVQAALKTEPVNTPHPLLVMEAHVMTKLDTLRDGDGKHFCRCLDLGRDEQRDQQSGQMKKFNYIVMSLVGRGLDGVEAGQLDHRTSGIKRNPPALPDRLRNGAQIHQGRREPTPPARCHQLPRKPTLRCDQRSSRTRIQPQG